MLFPLLDASVIPSSWSVLEDDLSSKESVEGDLSSSLSLSSTNPPWILDDSLCRSPRRWKTSISLSTAHLYFNQLTSLLISLAVESLGDSRCRTSRRWKSFISLDGSPLGRITSLLSQKSKGKVKLCFFSVFGCWNGFCLKICLCFLVLQMDGSRDDGASNKTTTNQLIMILVCNTCKIERRFDLIIWLNIW